MKQDLAVGFVLDALEHERGGVRVYAMALRCAKTRDLKKEWTRYHRQTKEHVEALTRVCTELGVDADHLTKARDIVKSLAEALVTAMEYAHAEADPATAELVACDCVALAEAKDRANWDLLGVIAEHLPGEAGRLLSTACERIRGEEAEHLAHAQSWGHSLALKKLGLDAALAPTEERSVRAAIAAPRSEPEREETT